MRSRFGLVLITFSLFILNACGSDDDPMDPGGSSISDTTAPAAVTDLQVLTFDETTATIIWTAPGDDDLVGTAIEYQIGYSAAPITPVSWSGCTMLSTCPTPTPAGSQQSAEIETPPIPDCYVALKAADESGNWSGLSNVAHGHIPTTFDIVQLTHEGDNRYPCLDDGFVTWVGLRVADTQEIWIAGLAGATASPTVLTDNGGEKMHPSSHGREKIVWMGRDRAENDWEIYVYSLQSIPRFRAVTDNDVQDWFPELAGGGDFAWQHGFTMFEEIHYWNGSSHDEIVLTDECCSTSDYTNINLAADDHTVVWQRVDRAGTGETRTYMWTGTRRDITDDLGDSFAHDFSLDNGALAYEWSALPAIIKYWNGVTVQEIGDGYDPSLDDGWIAFEGWDGHDWEVYLWDGISIEQITDNDFDDFDPSLSGNRLAWAGRPTGPAGLYQIFYTALPER